MARFADRALRLLTYIIMEDLAQDFALRRGLVASIPGTMKRTSSVVSHQKNVAVDTCGQKLLTPFVNVTVVRFLDFIINE